MTDFQPQMNFTPTFTRSGPHNAKAIELTKTKWGGRLPTIEEIGAIHREVYKFKW